MRGDCMNKWEILGIEPTHDVKLIRRRYAELVRLYHPEDQPEIYQQIVEAYQSALREARSKKTRQESGRSEASSTQHFSNQEEKIVASPLNFETLSEESTAHESNASSHILDFSDYLESEYLIRNAIESIVGNPDYTIEEQENLWQQFFSQYRYDMGTVQSVLEEMDVYIFNKPEQFSIIIPLLEDYVPDFKYWGYYYKLKHWKVKRATAYKNGESLEDAKKEITKLYASYRLCQAILEDSQKANQIRIWIKFFKQSFSPSTVIFLLNNSKQMITCIPVLAYILEKIKPRGWRRGTKIL
jgi:dnaJ domain protein